MTKIIKDKIAVNVKEEYLKDRNLASYITKLVSGMEINAVSPAVPVSNEGFIIFKLEGFRYPEIEDYKIKENVQTAVTSGITAHTTEMP